MQLRKTDDCAFIEPRQPASAAVIWLHGLGADGFDFVPIAGQLGLPDAVRYVFPHAPMRSISLNGGLPMRGWYDILSLDRRGLQDAAGIEASAERVRGLIADQVGAGVPERRLVIAGFSQGGAVALHAALRHPQRLGGLLALSTYLPLHERLTREAAAANRDLPILMCHGRFDPVLPLELGTDSRDLLLAQGYAVRWADYPMQHEVCTEELSLIGEWLKPILFG